jgi:hypothetical protein
VDVRTQGGSEDDEPSPVVLDELAHDFPDLSNSLKNSADVKSKNGLKVVKDRNEARYPSLRTGRTKSEKRIEEGLSI